MTKKEKTAWIVLLVYTFLNLKVIADIAFNETGRYWWATQGAGAGTATTVLGLVVGLFLNAALILYWLNKDK